MRRTFVLALSAIVLASAPVAAHAADVLTAADVVAIEREADGTRLTLQGEAVGEDLRADADHRWVNLLSGGVAVGVWMTNADADAIGRFGDYRGTGDTVRVTGIVNIACDEHAGEFDVHAEQIAVIADGSPTPRQVEPWKGFAGIVFIGVGMFLWWYFRRIREREVP